MHQEMYREPRIWIDVNQIKMYIRESDGLTNLVNTIETDHNHTKGGAENIVALSIWDLMRADGMKFPKNLEPVYQIVEQPVGPLNLMVENDEPDPNKVETGVGRVNKMLRYFKKLGANFYLKIQEAYK